MRKIYVTIKSTRNSFYVKHEAQEIFGGYMEFDAFAGGIELGGLRSMLDIKILVCYIISAIRGSITREQLCDAMQKSGMVNYFDLNEALDKLIGNNMISQDDKTHVLTVSKEGAAYSNELKDIVLPVARERAVKAALAVVARARAEKENDVYIEKVEKGYDVRFVIRCGEDRMMEITINVCDMLQAEQLKEGFLNDPSAIYSGIINKLLENS